MSLLKDIDEKYVPRMAEALDRVARRFPQPPPATGPLPVILRLRRWDDRWTTAGPLALLRDIPQLGAVLLAVLVLVSGATVRSRVEAQRAAEQRAGAGDPGPSATPVDGGGAPHEGVLGPQLGMQVATYLDETRKKLVTVAPRNPDAVGVAVVSFRDYKTPEEVVRLVGPVQIRQVFYRAAGLKVNQATAQSAPVEDVVADSKRAFRARARTLETEAANNRSLAATIENDPAQKREHERDAALWEYEARILKGECQCVYSVVVRGRMRLLLDMANIASVRAVDISDADAKIEDFTFTGLLPEERDVVTGGNEE